MASIKPIESRSVHQIQSGQVIVDLCSVVKELVENSLDADASSIEVRFKNHGLDSIEVQDNGKGISPEDYETLALKHYTSKLSSYEDLSSLHTFGFRGEALSSLCALSIFHVRTAREGDGSKGTRLDFETSGKLKSTSVVASQKGTTVAVDDIFRSLPVRRKELEKNIKREYGKVLSLLHAYACISTGVRFSVSNQLAKNKKVNVFSTKSNSTTKENIANIYGAKTIPALVPLDLGLEMEPSNAPTQGARNWSTQDDASSKEVHIVGHISRPVFGEGRPTPDRQMFFVNSRPCALPQVAKAFNEVYKSFNVSQSPFVFANLKLDTNAYDVNVSPDKRTILLHDQTTLLETLKSSLTQLFESHDQSVPLSSLPNRNMLAFKPLTMKPFAGAAKSPSTSPEKDSIDDFASGTVTTQPTESSSLATSSICSERSTSLIEKFAKRNAQTQDKPIGFHLQNGYPAKDKSLVQTLKPQLEIGRNDHPPEIDVQTTDTEEGNKPFELPRPVQDFNACIASQQAKRARAAEANAEQGIPPYADEPPIPSLFNSSQKASPGPVQSAFNRMRPKRKAVEQATITIDDTTTTMTIGPSSSAKKPRSHYIRDPTERSPVVNLFGKKLQAFSAPGTQIEDDEPSDSVEDDLGVSRAKNHSLDGEDETEGEGTLATSSDGEDDRQLFTNAEHDDEAGETAASHSEELEHSTDVRKGAISESSDGDAHADNADPDMHVEETNDAFLDEDENDQSDSEHLDEAEKKAREDARVAQLIEEAEEAAAQPTEDNLRRASQLLKGRNQKTSTLSLLRDLDTTIQRIEEGQTQLDAAIEDLGKKLRRRTSIAGDDASKSAEEKLSLNVSKSDFEQMQIIGQFNLGFIIALRPSTTDDTSDELFIIDQHASDEKFNFERLQRTTIVSNQQLVAPVSLELTAIDEETILEHPDALTRNGFLVEVDTEAEGIPMGRRTKLLGLPISKEVTFTLADLEELLVLLREWHGSTTDRTRSRETLSPNEQRTAFDILKRTVSDPFDGIEIPRPSKVRKMFAMRACRGSIMIGRNLTLTQMQKVVRHLGGLDKPWNCPHGRPTMRHLAGLGDWQGWEEGNGLIGLGENTQKSTDWSAYLKAKKEGKKAKAKVVYGATGSEWTETD